MKPGAVVVTLLVGLLALQACAGAGRSQEDSLPTTRCSRTIS